MAKSKTHYVCQSCGADFLRWVGRCPECENWNSLVEELKPSAPAAAERVAAAVSSLIPLRLQDIEVRPESRLATYMEELNRALGGGIVPGSLILLGGEPGIGKSTLLLQVAYTLAEQGRHTIIYITGEESAQQVRLRAERMGYTQSQYFYLLAETDVPAITHLLESQKPAVAIIDSIQAIYDAQLESPPGSISQVKNSANELMRIAKKHHINIWIIGHVNKEGNIAGPKVLEHMVDTVLYFEGERYRSYRLLRTIKNRFGATNEVGVFEMTGDGLEEVTNPSALFLAEFDRNCSGSAIVVTMEGTRPMLVEIQALSYPTYANLPKRSANGMAYQRLIQILAVLEKRIGLTLSKADVLVNVVGGLTINEPAADLGVAMALISSVRDIAIDGQTVFIGEVGLGGEVRNVNYLEMRLKEAVKLGFNRAIVPASGKPKEKIPDLEVIGIRKVMDGLVYLKRGE